MNDQDIVQSPNSSAGDEELATSAEDTGSLDTAESPETAPTNEGQSAQRVIEPERFNRLQSQYKETLGRLREYDQKAQYYAGLEQELRALKQQLEGKKETPQQQQPIDYSQMPIDQYTKLVVDQAKQEAIREFERNLAMQREQQTAQERQQKQAERKSRFDERYDTIRSHDPDIDEDALWKWMEENDAYNPILAYNYLYRDVLSQKQQAKIEKQVAAKMASNSGTKLEGAGKQGVIPTPSPDTSSPNARAEGFTNMLLNAP